MANAKEELLSLIEHKQLKCADITYGGYFLDDPNKTVIQLKVNYTKEEYINFLNKMDFEYDDGYGGQNLYGLVWFKDGSWAERGEYDGSEWWEHKILPDIPQELIT